MSEYVPSAQGVHVVEPAAAQDPRAQHVAEPVSLNVLGAQGEQAGELGGL